MEGSDGEGVASGRRLIILSEFKWTDLTAAPYPHVPTPLASILTNMLLGLLYFSLALLVDHFVSGMLQYI